VILQQVYRSMGRHGKPCRHLWSTGRGLLSLKVILQEWVLWKANVGLPIGRLFLLVVNRDHSSKLLSFWRQTNKLTDKQKDIANALSPRLHGGGLTSSTARDISRVDDWRRLTVRQKMQIVASELGGHAELLPHDPVFAFAVQGDCRRMMYHLRTQSINTDQPRIDINVSLLKSFPEDLWGPLADPDEPGRWPGKVVCVSKCWNYLIWPIMFRSSYSTD